MNKEDLKIRTKKFSLTIIKLIEKIPNTKTGNTIAHQLIRSATSTNKTVRNKIRNQKSEIRNNTNYNS